MALLPDGRLRSWIARYNIVFEGPLPSLDWPTQYTTQNDNRGLLTVSEIKERVVNINKVAFACRSARANEQTWRLKIEHWILWRFDAEVACHKCRKRLWISEIQTLPNDSDRAEELRSRRAQRVLCTCSQSERAMVDRRDRGQTRVFADRAEDFVLHQDSMELLGCGVKERKPDRIFGLETTTVFDKYVSTEENLRHSPFADGKILYPFLIIEAKSEKGSPGFESIESQTAFPIRSLLQLQDNLARHTGVKINPLLWFLANQGDEWRVYAAVVDNSQFRIFDLWHGTILSQDCALQLLLIIDCICEWARDIYRLDVLRCLSGGKLDLRAITPAWGSSHSQSGVGAESDEPLYSSMAGLVTLRAETPPQPTALPDLASDELIPRLDATMLDVDSLDGDDDDDDDDDALLTELKEVNNNHTMLRYDRRHHDSPVWTKLATIQHSNHVQFTFQHFRIPEDLGPLQQFLSKANASRNLALAAQETLSLFEGQSAIQTDMTAIVRLAELWVGDADSLLMETETRFSRSVQARVAFQTYFDIETWQTVRLLDCFICSQKAWNLLLQVSRYENPPARHPWTSDQRADLLPYVNPLRCLHGKESITAALLKLELQLCGPDDSSRPGLRWEEADRLPVEDLFSPKDNLGQAGSLQQYGRSTTMQRELFLTGPRASWLDPMLQARSMKGEEGAILLRKPPTWPTCCPFFCLAVFDPDVDFEDEGSLGRILAKVHKAKDIYVVTDGVSKSRPGGDADDRAVELWAGILEGNAAANAPWPMLS